MPVLLWILLSMMAGYYGRNTRFGFLGIFCVSVLLSPLVVFLALFFLGITERPKQV